MPVIVVNVPDWFDLPKDGDLVMMQWIELEGQWEIIRVEDNDP